MKTAAQWLREGRRITKGEHAEMYLLSDDRTQARALFRREQTTPASDPDASDSWTIQVTAAEWELIKAEAREISRGPRVKLRRHDPEGVEIWCGPDADVIALLQNAGYRYNPRTRYWQHPNKDPETVARAFENGKLRGQKIRVTRAWDHAELEV